MRHVPEPTRDSDHDAYCSPFPKLLTLATAAVQLFMAARAQGNQVGIFVRALLTALLSVMDLQIPLRATDLAPPVVPLHHLLAKLLGTSGDPTVSLGASQVFGS
jgi:hypothetical protein